MPERLSQLNNWLSNDCSINDCSIKPLFGDASFRRYFRVTLADGETRIAMDAPPPQEDCRPFVDISNRLEAAGVHVPHIHAQDLQQGFLLLEDLGDTQYLEKLNAESAPRLYGDALGALSAMQACAATDGLPLYDEALLGMELELFREWLCQKHLGLTLSDAENRMLEQLFAMLIENAQQQPQHFVHRDYHSRNLMMVASHGPGVIDFQDAVIGPITYDLVSLLKDAYIRWPLEQVDNWAEGYCELAIQSGLMPLEDEAKFQRWFDLMGVQRHIKVAGIFARLYRRDGKEGYLDDIPLVLEYIMEMVARYPQLEALGRFIENRVTPGLSGNS
ncbi:MAG TPA: aminoglycoside phosphotransferase [Gammaproteobacteria bacterium]|nr:aminoglycoside phosphotransferase [Gammaproteobacteria bacterium]